MTGPRASGWRVVAVASASVAVGAVVLLAIDVRAGAAAPSSAPTSEAALAAATPVPSGGIWVRSDRGTRARFEAFNPGSVERWRISATTGGSADLGLRVERSGALAARADGLALRVDSCSGSWSAGGVCGGSATTLRPPTALVDAVFDQPLRVGRVPSGSTTHLLLTFTLPDSAAARTDDSLMGRTATVAVVITGSGGLSGGGLSGGGAGAGGVSGGGTAGLGVDGGVRPGQGGAGQAGSGRGGSSGAEGSGSGAVDGGRNTGAGSGVADGESGSGLGGGLLAWTGSRVALPIAVGVGLVTGGAALVVGRYRRRPHSRGRSNPNSGSA